MSNTVKDMESIYAKVITPFITLGKGDFFLIEIQPKRLEEYISFVKKNSSVFRLIRVKEEVNESEQFGEVFSIILFTDLDMESIKNRRWVYTFRLLFWRGLTHYERIAEWVMTPNQYTSLKIAIRDTSKKSKFVFICKIRSKIFIKFDNKILAYDTKYNKVLDYWDSKQNSLFENNLLELEDIIFFEKFILGSLD